MSYKRPINESPLSKAEKLNLLKEYIEHYRGLGTSGGVLNRKVPRGAFDELLNSLGETLLVESKRLASTAGPMRTFLDDNKLTPAIAERLKDDFRVFCLALNALKQWVAAEQAATDRYLLGGNARELCRAASTRCLVSDELLGTDCELHHPVRDGRPPVPLSKRGHAEIEGQLPLAGDDAIGQALLPLRRKSNQSWAHLRAGCLELLGEPVAWTSNSTKASAQTFARKAKTATNTGYGQIIDWMDEKEL
jgi:hypothetical protein